MTSARRTTPKLAMLGGPRTVPRDVPVPRWPVVTEGDRQAVQRVLDSGRFTSASSGEREITGLEHAWARRTGTRHCAAVSNGTTALSLALAACGVAAGDEVVVPALSFVATALAPLHLGAIPVFVDIDPATFNLDPAGLEAAVTSRTRAVVPVHLHGLPADMDEIRAVADRHDLVVVEDAAQAHGVRYQGRPVGSLGHAGAFSLNVSKNLPTCGEGGLVTTDDASVHDRVTTMRQFGERIPDRGERAYVSETLGWNAKISAVQAAFTRSQLARFDDDQRRRERNVQRFLRRLTPLAGLAVPVGRPDRGHGWHILRFRVDPAPFGALTRSAAALRAVICRALKAEGVPVSRYQVVPLPCQPIFTRGSAAAGWRSAPCRVTDIATAAAVVEDSFTIQRAHLNPAAGPVLDRYADAFEKVWDERDVISRMAEARATAGADTTTRQDRS
ncbi:MAG: DegT/DnrJ/EryC1/StrS family aminotransferase [Egibacteraceae bacterium]